MEVVVFGKFRFFPNCIGLLKKQYLCNRNQGDSPLNIFDTMFFLTPHNKGYGSTYTICVYRIR